MRFGVVILVVVAALTLAPASLGAVRFTRIYYNPPGNDTQTNSQIVKEYVQLKNTGKGPVALTNWRVIDVDDRKVYVFPKFTLPAGASVRIRSGVGRNTKTDLYWGHDNYIWNNDQKETAVLRNARGAVAAKCTYTAGVGPAAICP